MLLDQRGMLCLVVRAPGARRISGYKTKCSVTASMNDLINHAKLWLADVDMSPHDVGFKFNDILLSAIAKSKKDGYGKPNEALKTLADYTEVEAK